MACGDSQLLGNVAMINLTSSVWGQVCVFNWWYFIQIVFLKCVLQERVVEGSAEALKGGNYSSVATGAWKLRGLVL